MLYNLLYIYLLYTFLPWDVSITSCSQVHWCCFLLYPQCINNAGYLFGDWLVGEQTSQSSVYPSIACHSVIQNLQFCKVLLLWIFGRFLPYGIQLKCPSLERVATGPISLPYLPKQNRSLPSLINSESQISDGPFRWTLRLQFKIGTPPWRFKMPPPIGILSSLNWSSGPWSQDPCPASSCYPIVNVSSLEWDPDLGYTVH